MDVNAALSHSLAGLPAFVLYFAAGLILLAIFFALYTRITPYDELALIREGNVAAAVALSGSLLGFVLPLASAIAHSVGLLDMVVWALIAMIAQVVVYFAIGRAVAGVAEAIRAGGVATAALLATASVAVGILNAAALTY